VSEFTPVIERNLFASVHAYEYAINIIRNLSDHEKKRLNLLTKRFGNVRNEMGVYWMNRCAQAVNNLDQETDEVRLKTFLCLIVRLINSNKSLPSQLPSLSE
jgi:hypothetical protein